MQQETWAASSVFINSVDDLAQIYGAYIFPSLDAPKYILVFG